MTKAPVKLTKALVKLTKAPVKLTKAPVKLTKAPVKLTKAPVKLTEAPPVSSLAVGLKVPGHLWGLPPPFLDSLGSEVPGASLAAVFVRDLLEGSAGSLHAVGR